MGNICRSPMAEGIMRNLIESKKLNAMVDSAGTIEFHQGELPDKRAQDKALQHGIDITKQRARPFEYQDFKKFNLIYVMDEDNFSDILSRARSQEDIQKVKMIMNEVYPDQNIDVPDPYYEGDKGFENVFQMLFKACNCIAEKIK